MTTNFGKPLPEHLREAVNRELQYGEQILWTGQPDEKRVLKTSGCIVLFAIPWTAFAIFWMGAAGWGGSHVGGVFNLMPLFGLPFVAIGLLMFASPYWSVRQARNTAYLITERRILFVTLGGLGSTTKTYLPVAADIERFERADGSGDLTFKKEVGRDSDGDPTVSRTQFLGIPEVRRVEKLLSENLLAKQNNMRDNPQGDWNTPVMSSPYGDR